MLSPKPPPFHSETSTEALIIRSTASREGAAGEIIITTRREKREKEDKPCYDL